MINRMRRQGDDAGYSLTELLISMMIFGILMAITFSVLINIMNMTKDTVGRSQAIQQARIGVSQIDLQVRSGQVIRNPEFETVATSGVDPFFSMRILTNTGNQMRCAQWRVIDTVGNGFGDLQFRTWDPEYPISTDVTDWSIVAFNLVAMDVEPTSVSDIDPDDPSTWPPFWVDDSIGGDTQAQFVRITLRMKSPDEREDALPTSVRTLVTGRNTVFGNNPEDSCTPVPPP